MNRKIGSMYLSLALLTLIGKTMEGRYLLVNLTSGNLTSESYTYFEDHECTGKILFVQYELEEAEASCNVYRKDDQRCGCISLGNNTECTLAKGSFFLYEGFGISESDQNGGCAWVRS